MGSAPGKITADEAPSKRLFSRRDFIKLCAMTAAVSGTMRVFPGLAAAQEAKAPADKSRYVETIAVLNEAYGMEMYAHRHYLEFKKKAVSDSHPNIAYLFTALASSEYIHARNYKRVLSGLTVAVKDQEVDIEVLTTKENLTRAGNHELEFIDRIYPEFLERIEPERHEDAIINTVYSWDSHKQHRKSIKKLLRWSGIFFETIARKFDRMDVRYYVCQVCGSTVTKLPEHLCVICAKPVFNYMEIEKA